MSDYDVTRDDLALDAIAHGATPPGDDPALALLAALRTGLEEPAPEAPVAPVVPLRPRRSGLLVALAAAAGLVVGGITAGAVVVADRPGELLYAAHRAVLGTDKTKPAEVTSLLDRAAGLLARGDRTGARRLIAQARPLVESVPLDERPALRARIADLSALAAEPTPAPSPSPDRHGGASETPEPVETSDDHSGPGGGGDDTNATPSPSESDHSGGGGSGSGSGSGGSSEPGDDHSGSDH